MHMGVESFWISSRFRFSDYFQCDAGRSLRIGYRSLTSPDSSSRSSVAWVPLESLIPKVLDKSIDALDQYVESEVITAFATVMPAYETMMRKRELQ